MEKIKFYQIVIPDSPVSMEYHERSVESFEIVDDLVEIVPFKAITPTTPNFDEHQSKYNWCKSLMRLDNGNEEYDEPHSPTERAGMCSHWELLRLRGETDERFFVTEHDTYLIPELENEFRYLVDIIMKRDLEYANIGLFMGCYSVSQSFGAWSHHIFTQREFPINGGPYGCMERLYKTYVSKHWKHTDDYRNKEYGFVHPWGDCDSVRFAKTEDEMFDTYNSFPDKVFKGTRYGQPDYWIKNPTTQMIKKDLKVTQDHRQYPQHLINEPWKRHKYFKVID